jgi:carboxyl-terminal processing protease
MKRITLLAIAALSTTALPTSAQTQSSEGDRNRDVAQEAQVFLNAFQVIRNYGLTPMSDSAVWSKALDGLIGELDDPYASVFTPQEFDEFQEENTGNYAGIGVQITQLNERITITAVFRRTPAERAGLQVGDVILGVEGESTEGWTTSRASEVIRGPVGTSVGLSIGRQGLTSPMRESIQRDSVHVSAVVADRVARNVGYIALDRVARASAAEVDSALTMLGDTRGVILDLRGNPGGFMDESLMISDLFLDPGEKMLSIASRTPGQETQTVQEEYEASEPARIPGKPVIVLVDRFSASASEIVAGALQDNDRGLVMGERTFGKGVYQNVFRLTPTRHLRLTTGEWYTPLGRSLHRPRRIDGRPFPEDPDTFAVLQTESGREVSGGGGVFPDLEIANDTLTTLERAFLSQAAQAEVPLALRIEELAFAQAEVRREAGDDPYVDRTAFEAFTAGLEEAGVEREYLEDDDLLRYLEWRINVRVSERMERTDASIEYRRSRDPVLDEAIRLLQGSESQAALFAAADARQEQIASSGAQGTEGSDSLR